jgi:hypothetical protein
MLSLFRLYVRLFLNSYACLPFLSPVHALAFYWLALNLICNFRQVGLAQAYRRGRHALRVAWIL